MATRLPFVAVPPSPYDTQDDFGDVAPAASSPAWASTFLNIAQDAYGRYVQVKHPEASAAAAAAADRKANKRTAGGTFNLAGMEIGYGTAALVGVAVVAFFLMNKKHFR